jgi:hypothetical protein
MRKRQLIILIQYKRLTKLRGHKIEVRGGWV